MVVNHHEGARTIQFTASNTQFQLSKCFLKNTPTTYTPSEFDRLFQSVGPETAKLRGPERMDEHLGMS